MASGGPWGHEADTAISFHNAAQTPQFVFDAASAAVASLLGLVKFGQGPGPGGLDWGRPLLILALVLGGWRLHRIGRMPRELWIALALAGTFWVLAGLNEKIGRSNKPASRRGNEIRTDLAPHPIRRAYLEALRQVATSSSSPPRSWPVP